MSLARRTVLVVAVGLCVAGFTQAQELSSPWGWRCDGKQCIKEDATEMLNLVTLNQCKLTCDARGMLWPQPSAFSLGKNVSTFLPDNIAFQPTCQGEVCLLLNEAFSIFKDNLQRYHPEYSNGEAPWTGPWDGDTETHMLYVEVTVDGEDINFDLNTDETYTLAVMTTDDLTTAVIFAPTYFAARHALETLSQLIDYHETADALMVVTEASIVDAPVFPYRGLLVDTSRNFMSVESLKRTIDGMAASKLNVLHWHITDSHSFPLVVDSVPSMALYGAYTPRQVYTGAQVQALVDYAKVRGVRLLPEIDIPAHVGNGWQWGEKEGLGNLAVCVNKEPWADYCVEPPCGQLNLANPNIYDVLGKIFTALVDLFPITDLFHYGGDEINMNCWNSSDEIYNWMIDNGYGVDAEAYVKQWAVFQEKARQLVINATDGRETLGVLFTSELTKPEHIEIYLDPSQYVVQIWTTKDDPIIKELLERGYRIIFSNFDAWYLDCGGGAWVGEGNNWCSPYKGWQTVYENNPYNIAIDLTGLPHEEHILGGEAALWTEQIDDATLDSRFWPRGAALGERLWSNLDDGWYAAEASFIHHRQRLVQRGLRAERIQPQWCHQNDYLCYL